MTAFGGNTTGGLKDYGMNPMQLKVFNFIKSAESRIGIHRDQIVEHFPANQKRQIM